MVMEDNEQPSASIVEASASQVAERSLWDLSRDEQRILIITFVGGLASIVVGACVIGGAIGIARSLRTDHYPLNDQFIGTATVTLIIAVFVIYRLRAGAEYKPLLRLMLIVMVPVAVLLAMFLLAWIGLAAGIH